MKELKNFVTPLHVKSKRDYVARVTEFDKGDCAIVAKEYSKDYWDGQRQFGYGGYSYDGRWEAVAQNLIDTYKLNSSSHVLDIGCGKGYLLFELSKLCPGLTVRGLDISEYAIKDAKEEIRDFITLGHAKELPFKDNEFDLVISNTTFHNLKINDLFSGLREVARVKKKDAWICVESYRNEHEKANLLYWQLTCESFYSPEEWQWIYDFCAYDGDFEFIYFE